jgi:hypothetical protein
VYLAMAALMALVILVPTATAQEMMDESMMNESMMMDESMMEQPQMMDDSMMMEQPKMEQPNSMEKGKMEMPMTGGLSLGLLLLAAAALLAGMSLMAGACRTDQRIGLCRSPVVPEACGASYRG